MNELKYASVVSMEHDLAILTWYTIKELATMIKLLIQYTGTVKPVFMGHLYIQEKVSLHDRCPFITGSLTWGR